MRKLDNPARNSLNQWLHKNARLLKRKEMDEYNHLLIYSVGGHPVIILDMYNKSSGNYAGFEVLTEAGANSVQEAIDELEQLLD